MSTWERVREIRMDAIEDLQRGFLYGARDKITIAIEIYEKEERYPKGDEDYD